MTVYRTDDPAVIQAYLDFQELHAEYAARVASIHEALELPKDAHFVQSGYGAVAFLVGIRCDPIPAGWRLKEAESDILIPDTSTNEGAVARILMDSLENIPTSRAAIDGRGMPTDVVVGKRVHVPGVRFDGTYVYASWNFDGEIVVDDAVWERMS